jgi:cation/acetate symporter
MLATTWVQIIKAVLLMAGSIFLSVLVLRHFNFSIDEFFGAIGSVEKGGQTYDFLEPGMRFGSGLGRIDLISLGMALVLGTAGLPHILVRFYTVPDAKTARVSVVWAMIIIGPSSARTT